MKPRTTLFLAVICGGLFAYIWFVDSHQNSTREEAQAASKVLKIETEEVGGLSIRHAGEEVQLTKKEGVWVLEQPLKDRADSAVVARLLGLLESLRHDSKIELTQGKEAEQLKEFGVAESELSLKIKPSNGKEIELLLGKDSAVEGKLYVRQQGQNTVYVVRNELRTQLTQKTEAFRDHKLAATPTQSVQKLTIKTAEGELELEHKNQHWDIIKPLRARAADPKVNDLLSSLLTAQISQFFPEEPSPEQGLSEPRATVTMQVEGQKEPLVLQIGAASTAEADKEKSFTKLSSRAAVTLLSNTALDPLLKARPNDLRDRKLLRVEADIVDRITIEAANKPSLTLARKGEGWIQKDGDKELPVKDGLAPKLLSALQTAEAVNFVTDVASDLTPYGLSTPNIKVRLSSYASENTAETKAGERPVVSVLFGLAEGDNGYAKLEEEPFVVAVPKSLASSIPTEAAELRPQVAPVPVSIIELHPEEVTNFQASSQTGTTGVEKKAGEWTVSGAEGAVDTDALQRVLERLGSLKGVHVDSSEPYSKAVESPLLTVRIVVEKEGKPSRFQLLIGAATPEGLFPTSVTGKEGFFLLNADDKAALETKLTR